jgi:predicted nucleic acid-binding protein
LNYTVDASVFVSAARDDEENHRTSLRFLRMLEARGAAVVCPTLVIPECSAAIARPTGDPELAAELVNLIVTFPGLQLVPLSAELATAASKMACQHRLRGADAVYAAVAADVQSILVTWDHEMLERCPSAIRTITPGQALRMRRRAP